MKQFLNSLIASITIACLFSACTQDATPISTGTKITLRNTLQVAADSSMGGTGGIEKSVESVLGVPENTFVRSASVGNGIEFDDFLGGLYDIDFSENEIKYTLVAAPNDPTFSAFFRTLEPGTFDRYYITFNENHNINSATSSDSSTSLKVISPNEVMIEIGEGFNFNSGTTFVISLE